MVVQGEISNHIGFKLKASYVKTQKHQTNKAVITHRLVINHSHTITQNNIFF
jgi:hypothetical protein